MLNALVYIWSASTQFWTKDIDMPLHIRLVCENILWCHPPQWHLVLEGGHILGCVSGETKVGYLEQLPIIHQDVAAGQVSVEDTQGGEVLLSE